VQAALAAVAAAETRWRSIQQAQTSEAVMVVLPAPQVAWAELRQLEVPKALARCVPLRELP
jgi:hypothetical protein